MQGIGTESCLLGLVLTGLMVVVLLGPLAVEELRQRAQRAIRAHQIHRKLTALSKQPPSGMIEHYHLRGGLMVYADLTALPHEEQDQFKARLDAGEHPESVFADIEQRLRANQRES